jgi:hypothetical protein
MSSIISPVDKQVNGKREIMHEKGESNAVRGKLSAPNWSMSPIRKWAFSKNGAGGSQPIARIPKVVMR